MKITNNDIEKRKQIREGCILITNNSIREVRHLLVTKPDTNSNEYHFLCLESNHVVFIGSREDLNDIELDRKYKNKYTHNYIPISKIYEPYEIELILGGKK